MKLSLAVALLGLTTLVLASRVYLEYETALPLPAGWVATQKEVDRTTVKSITFALKQRNLDTLESLFWRVTDPKSPEYTNYLTVDELTDLIAPSQETQNALIEWLESVGVSRDQLKWTHNKDFVDVDLPVSKLEDMFNVQFQIFHHLKTRKDFVGTLGPYSVPASLQPHVSFVSGLIGLPKVQKKKVFIGDSLIGSEAIIPDVIRARYNVTSGLINSFANNSHAVAEFQGQYYSPSDLKEFFSKYVTVGQEFDTIYKVVGNNDAGSPQIEASLDTQYIMGVAPNASTWFIIVPAMPFWSDLLKWVEYLSDNIDIPWVHSISYGSQGDYPSASYRDRLDTEFQKLGLRGVSIIFASGDSGAGCMSGDGVSDILVDVDAPAAGCVLAPSYPATNIYVTSVGATGFISGNSGPEEAVNYPDEFKSGGGFDLLFPRPSYQDAAVTNYLKTASKLPPQGAYNASNRATPDVAALGSIHFMVINGGQVTPVGGTSASAPTFAAIITLLNQIRLQRGDNPLGFLNPWIYQTAAANPDAFFDVVVGNNIWPCCRGSTGISGYMCAPGWDPVTGVGTPNYEVLQNLV